MRILVVEDDKKIASFISKGLKEAGFAVDVAMTVLTVFILDSPSPMPRQW